MSFWTILILSLVIFNPQKEDFINHAEKLLKREKNYKGDMRMKKSGYKRIIFVFFFICCTQILFTTEWGDVNDDASVDIVDALLTAQYYVGLNPQGFLQDTADVSADGAIDIVDALLIAQFYVG